MIYLDTHVVAWLFAGRVDLLPRPVVELIDRDELLISPIVALELQYLFEIARTTEPAKVVVEALTRELGLKSCDLPFTEVIVEALNQSWTRDPFDRIIVSHAQLRGTSLLTKDQTIRDHFTHALWPDG